MSTSSNYGVFDIIGPIMIGPSSSHTAGAVRIGLVSGQLCGFNPKAITVFFHGSLKSTYSTHKTDAGVVAGVLGFPVDDDRIKCSIELARSSGIQVEFNGIELKDAHPSTIIVKTMDAEGKECVLRASTIGGGNIVIEEVDGIKLLLDGKQNCIFGLTEAKDVELLKKEVLGLGNGNTVDFEKQQNGFMFKICGGETVDPKAAQNIASLAYVRSVKFIKAVMPIVISSRHFYSTCKELMDISVKNNCQMSDTIIQFEAECSGRSAEAVIDEMRQIYVAMRQSIVKGNEKESELLGNMFKGNAKRMDSFIKAGKSICGTTLSEVTRNALAVMEVNGSMGRIVACPTAGSAGTMPAAVITLAEKNSIPEEKAVKALFTGAGIGIIVAQNASISGAVGGCQAECGTASALSAAALTEMFGGNCSMVLSSVALALGNVMGMVCDPVAGMVEIPCIQRNVLAAANAIVSAEMALAGVDSVIPADEVIGAMDEVGKLMPVSLKDTLGAGLSNSPTARRFQSQINKNGNALTTTATL